MIDRFLSLGRVLAVSACASLVPGLAEAQLESKTPVSPAAPPTLSAPVFDTVTPTYNPADAANAAETMVAEVDGAAISLGEVAATIKELPADRQGLPFSELFEIARQQLITRQALANKASQQGLDSNPAVRRQIKLASMNILANEYLRQQAAKGVTEQMLLDRYTRDIAGKPGPDELHLHVIAVRTLAKGQDIVKQLRSGGDFATLAKQLSEDNTATAGGDLGFVSAAGIAQELVGPAMALEAGQVSAVPIASQGYWFVIKVQDRHVGPSLQFAAVRDQIETQIMREAAPEIVNQALAGLKARLFSIDGRETLVDSPNAMVRKTK
jgi:peptidyl-prolyl cis-trans isomerase C